jgi:hypothetical protein
MTEHAQSNEYIRNSEVDSPLTRKISWGSPKEIWVVIGLALLTGLILKIPMIFGIDENAYFPRNIGSILLPALLGYSFFVCKLAIKAHWTLFAVAGALVLYSNLLPGTLDDSALVLAYFHIPILVWFIFARAYLGEDWKISTKRIDFIRFNGEVVIMGGLLGLSLLLFSAITIALFELIGYHIEDIYFEKIAIWALGSIPVLTLYLVHNNRDLTSKISPIIAKLFTPPAFLLLLIFSIMLPQAPETIFDDRDLLLIFNMVLLAVMALILFSFKNEENSTFQLYLLFGLAAIAIIDNLLALSAIGVRLFEFGISANRLALFGLNLLMLSHLSYFGYRIIGVIRSKEMLSSVFYAMGVYLPVYGVWAAIVSLLFPLFFSLI